MNTSRTRILRISVPVAAALLALTACSSTSADSPTPEPAEQTQTTAADETPAGDTAEDMTDDMAATADDMTDDMAATADDMTDDMTADDAISTAGAYIDYADYAANPDMYDAGRVVLFFNADWCSTCQEAVGNLTSEKIPAGLTIVSIDYDSSDDLKRQYGITTQHTFVQVDANGDELAKWTGSTDAKGIDKKTV